MRAVSASTHRLTLIESPEGSKDAAGKVLTPTSPPQEDLRALQVRARGARRALGTGPAGKDDDETGVGLPETLHLRRRLGLRLRGVRVGPARAQARTGNDKGVESLQGGGIIGM